MGAAILAHVWVHQCLDQHCADRGNTPIILGILRPIPPVDLVLPGVDNHGRPGLILVLYFFPWKCGKGDYQSSKHPGSDFKLLKTANQRSEEVCNTNQGTKGFWKPSKENFEVKYKCVLVVFNYVYIDISS